MSACGVPAWHDYRNVPWTVPLMVECVRCRDVRRAGSPVSEEERAEWARWSAECAAREEGL